MDFDWIIVGAGLSGATLAERIATVRGESVLVVEQRDHIAGNAYDEHDEAGILVHRYGPHIFHTNSKEVWDYLSGFTAWRPYFHRVLASIEGRLVPVPFGLSTIEQLFPPAMAARLCDKLVAAYGHGARVPILKLRQTEDPDLRFIADYVYRNVFEGYTRKQWGMTPEALSPSVTARVPILVSRDERYFQDTYQAIPAMGYTAMVRRMLSRPGISVLLNTPWRRVRDAVRARRVVFCGQIDEYFDYRHGELPYRSLRFEQVTLPVPAHQAAGTVNYPNEYDWTRVTELKHLTGQRADATTLVYEYPRPHVNGETVPYYPIPTDDNRLRYERYRDEAERLKPDVLFVGRLADYQYYNMDQAVAAALKLFRTEIGGR